jgi:putative membrane protein
VPRIFGWAQAQREGPAVEALIFFAAALLFWWPLLSPSRLYPAIGFGGPSRWR